jgi:hypothetical protein
MPMIEISPPATGTNPISDLNRVDLPLPLTPTSAVIEPFGTEKVAPSSALLPLR